MICPPLPLQAAGHDSIFCRLQRQNGIVYYTVIFAGSEGRRDEYASQLASYYEGPEYGWRVAQTDCYARYAVNDARRAMAEMRRSDRDVSEAAPETIRSTAFLRASSHEPDPLPRHPTPGAGNCAKLSQDPLDLANYWIEHTCSSMGRLNIRVCFARSAEDATWPCRDGFHQASLASYGDRLTVPRPRHADETPDAGPGQVFLAVCAAPRVPTNIQLPEESPTGRFAYDCVSRERAPVPLPRPPHSYTGASTSAPSPACSAVDANVSGGAWTFSTPFSSHRLMLGADGRFTHERSNQYGNQRVSHGSWRLECDRVKLHYDDRPGGADAVLRVQGNELVERHGSGPPDHWKRFE
ncbi:MAG: hypothetical protein WCE75_09205 [Terracidiphilus sp.]